MASQQITCWTCGHIWDFSPPMGRSESCPHCGWDARVCKNCRFYDANTYRECIEEQAEWVKEKDRRNFCSWFESRGSVLVDTNKSKDNPLDQLFGGSLEKAKGKSKLEEEFEAFFKKTKDSP